jgi:hypothetical protein
MFVMARPSKETRFPTLTLFVNEDLPFGRITRRPNELPLNHIRRADRRVAETRYVNLSVNPLPARPTIFRNDVLVHQPIHIVQ